MTTLLIVDDDLLFRSSVARDLKARGFNVFSVPSVEKALELLAEQHFDVLITDLRLMGRDGIELLEAVRESSPATRTILMSAFASARDHERATDLGAVRILSKPFSSDELVAAVRQAVECSNGFHGSFHGLSLIDMLQLFHLGQRSLTLKLSGRIDGVIHMKGGELVHAEWDVLKGEDALRAILTAPSGSLRTFSLEDVPRTIHGRFNMLILDLLRKADEAKSGTRRLDALGELESELDKASNDGT